MKTALIIPTCGRPTLKRALDSALAQEAPLADILVVNDSGREIPYPRGRGVRLLQTAGRRGPTKARAVAVDALSPDVEAVCYLDDDDELLPNHTRLLRDKLMEDNEFAFSRAVYRYPDGTETEDPEPGNKDPDKAYYDPNALPRQNVAPVSSFMHTVGAYRRSGGWDPSVLRMEDWDLWGRMFVELGPPGYVDEATNVIHKDEGPNRTDSNPFVYAMSCHWRDVVEGRLRALRAAKEAREAGDGEARRLAEAQLGLLEVPRVAVVMPIHNAEKYLEEALRSLRDQTYGDFEVIAVNDGSTDASRQILEDFRLEDNGVHVRIFDSQQNQGVTRALNYGLLMSRSEYVARMDADDVSMPERFERQVEFLDANRDVGVVGSRFWSMNEGLENVIWDNSDIPLAPRDVARDLRDRCCVGHPTVMMRRRVVEVVGGYDESEECRAVEDYELWLRASREFGIANLPDHLLKHRTYGGQVSDRLSEVQKRNTEALREKYRSTGS